MKMKCTEGKKHKYSKWEMIRVNSGLYSTQAQQRKCDKCGWIQRATLDLKYKEIKPPKKP